MARNKPFFWKDVVNDAHLHDHLGDGLSSVTSTGKGWQLDKGDTYARTQIAELYDHLGCEVVWDKMYASGKKFLVALSFLPNNCFSVSTIRVSGDEQDRFNAGLFVWATGLRKDESCYDVARYNAPHSTHKPYWHIDVVDENNKSQEYPGIREPDLKGIHLKFLEWASHIILKPTISPAPWSGNLDDSRYRKLASGLFSEVSGYLPHRELAVAAVRSHNLLFGHPIVPPAPKKR